MALAYITEKEYDKFVDIFLSYLCMDSRYSEMLDLIYSDKIKETHKSYRSRIWCIVQNYLKHDTLLNYVRNISSESLTPHYRDFQDLLFKVPVEELPLKINECLDIKNVILKWRLSVFK
jgi:hypothetical protein